MVKKLNLSERGRQFIFNLTEQQEGFRQFPYRDSIYKKLTIGYGFNLEDTGLSHEESLAVLEIRLATVEAELMKTLPIYCQQDEIRRIVLLEMAYNMGVEKLSQFHNMFKALENQDYKTASEEMLHSLWAHEVPTRAARLALLMENGTL